MVPNISMELFVVEFSGRDQFKLKFKLILELGQHENSTCFTFVVAPLNTFR